jgi:signal transduction histidine kinase
MKALMRALRQRQELILLVLMLESIHFALWINFGSPQSRSLMIIHFGLFLIWQPVWRGDKKLAWYNGILFILLTLAFITWMNLWLLFGWLILLTAVCGGRVLINRLERNNYMLVLLFLVSELLIGCTTKLFGVEVPPGVTNLYSILLPIVPLVMIFSPVASEEREERNVVTVDILHAAMTALLISLLIFGSLLIMYRSGVDYMTALSQTLIAIGFFLFAISWLLSPRLGFSGLSQLWMQSILNIGTPFEKWLMEIDNLFERESTADEFIEAAVQELASLPWLTGARWKTRTAEGEFGETSDHRTEIATSEIAITLYGRRTISGVLYLHCKLLVQLIHNFYVAKLRERKLTQQTHLQAIHETGARVTHDIKNLLQSLQAITSLIQSESDEDYDSPSRQVLKRQLPNLTQRLQLALDKLQAPETTPEDMVYLKDWWRDIRRRVSLPNIHFQADISDDPLIPADLFDSVVDNLLDNAREKAQLESDLTVTVSAVSNGRHIHILVCDTGGRVPDEKADRLLHEPLKSDTGLGIGLYQAARQAEALGYRLALDSNQNGKVCFELSNNTGVNSES